MRAWLVAVMAMLFTLPACSDDSAAVTTQSVDTVVTHAEIAPLLDRPWRVVAFGAVGHEDPTSDEFTDTLVFRLEPDGTGTASTQGCIVSSFPITFGADNTFVVDAPTQNGACENPRDMGQHVADVFTGGATVQWSIGVDGRLTLTSSADATTDAIYD